VLESLRRDHIFFNDLAQSAKVGLSHVLEFTPANFLDLNSFAT